MPSGPRTHLSPPGLGLSRRHQGIAAAAAVPLPGGPAALLWAPGLEWETASFGPRQGATFHAAQHGQHTSAPVAVDAAPRHLPGQEHPLCHPQQLRSPHLVAAGPSSCTGLPSAALLAPPQFPVPQCPGLFLAAPGAGGLEFAGPPCFQKTGRRVPHLCPQVAKSTQSLKRGGPRVGSLAKRVFLRPNGIMEGKLSNVQKSGKPSNNEGMTNALGPRSQHPPPSAAQSWAGSASISFTETQRRRHQAPVGAPDGTRVGVRGGCHGPGAAGALILSGPVGWAVCSQGGGRARCLRHTAGPTPRAPVDVIS